MPKFFYLTGCAVACCLALIFSGQAYGQTVEFVVVEKFIDHVQPSAADVLVNPAPIGPLFSGPYGFAVNVEGIGLSGISAPVVSGPISNPEPAHNGGVLGYDTEDMAWRYGSPNFNDWGAETLTEIDSLFGSGVYTVSNVLGAGVSLNLTGDAYPIAPVMTISGGSWSGGAYVIDPSQPMTITTSAFAEYGTHVDDAISVELFGDGVDLEMFHLFSEVPGTNSLTLTVPAFTLTPGETYDFWADFTSVVDVQPVAGFPDALAAAIYSTDTFVRIEAIGAALQGDLNADGFVGVDDLNIILGAWNQAVPSGDPLAGDPSGDGFVGVDDLNMVLGNWNAGSPPPVADNIPEPGTLSLACLGAFALLRRW